MSNHLPPSPPRGSHFSCPIIPKLSRGGSSAAQESPSVLQTVKQNAHHSFLRHLKTRGKKKKKKKPLMRLRSAAAIMKRPRDQEKQTPKRKNLPGRCPGNGGEEGRVGGARAKTPCLIGSERRQSVPLRPDPAHIHAGCQLAGRGGAATSGRAWGGRRRKRKGRAAAAAAEAEAEAAGGCSVAAAATALFRVDDGQPGQEGGGVRQRHRGKPPDRKWLGSGRGLPSRPGPGPRGPRAMEGSRRPGLN